MTQLKQTAPPNLTDLLGEHKREITSEMNCCQIGIIQSFDPSDQTATVQIALKKIVSVDALGVRTIAEHPLLLKVPVMVLYGGNGFLTMPIAQGDNCILLFNDREFDNWFVNGGIQTPTSFRVHDFSDAIAIVGIHNAQNALANYIVDGVRLGKGASMLTMKDTAVQLLTAMFTVTGNMQVSGNVTVAGTVDAGIVKSGNGVTGTYNIVTVQNGIVTGGS